MTKGEERTGLDIGRVQQRQPASSKGALLLWDLS